MIRVGEQVDDVDEQLVVLESLIVHGAQDDEKRTDETKEQTIQNDQRIGEMFGFAASTGRSRRRCRRGHRFVGFGCGHGLSGDWTAAAADDIRSRRRRGRCNCS